MKVATTAAWLTVPARWYLGLLFVGACLHKIADPQAFAVEVESKPRLAGQERHVRLLGADHRTGSHRYISSTGRLWSA